MADSSLPDATLALIEVLPVQVWTATPDGLLDFVNARASAEFGIPAAKLVADGWLSVLHPDDVAPTVARWTEALCTGEPYRVEFRLRSHTGDFQWYLACAEAQRDDSGAITRWVGSNTNIHEQYELQRRTLALLEQVGEQARDTQTALLDLREAKAAAERRMSELEAELARTPR